MSTFSLSRYRFLLLGLLLGCSAPALGQSFAAPVFYQVPASASPSGVTAGDVDNDGFPDMVASLSGTAQVAVWHNKKDGTFAAPAYYYTGPNPFVHPFGVALADFNKDSYLDIAVMNAGGMVGILLNKKDGTFAGTATTYDDSDNSLPHFLAAGDVNQDGYPDLAIADNLRASIGVLVNKKDGTFAPVVTYSTGSGNLASHVTLGDVNHDNYPDLVANLGTAGLVGVLLNKKDGTFGAVATYSTGANTSPNDLALSDLNNDGYLDLATANEADNEAAVLLNKKDGTFGPASLYPTGRGPEILKAGDVNNDGYPDLVLGDNYVGNVSVLLNKKNGTFGPSVDFTCTGHNDQGQDQPLDLTLADVNKDGKLDIITTSPSDNNVAVLLNKTTVLAAQPAAAATQVHLYPNPAATGATITLELAGLPTTARTVEATLLDATGQTCGRTLLPAQASVSLPTAGLAPGLYLLRLSPRNVQGAAVGRLHTQTVLLR